jgi:ribonuclease P protein component
MISRIFRFHGYGSLNYVYKHGKSVRTPACALKYIQNKRRSSPRMAVVVSKKVHKSAVTRNRIRRRVYEILRQHQPAITEPYDMVFTIFDQKAATMPHKELFAVITALLREAKII